MYRNGYLKGLHDEICLYICIFLLSRIKVLVNQITCFVFGVSLCFKVYVISYLLLEIK